DPDAFPTRRSSDLRSRPHARNPLRLVDIVPDVRKHWRESNSPVRTADFCSANVRVSEPEWHTPPLAGNLRGYIPASPAPGYSDNPAGPAPRRAGSNRTVNGWRDDIAPDADR